MLYLFDIFHKESPLLTVYSFKLGIINFWSILIVLDDKLLAFLISLTVTPYLLAILFKLSPFLTV